MTTRRRPRSRRTEDEHGAGRGRRHSRRARGHGAGRPPKGTHQEMTMDDRPNARTDSVARAGATLGKLMQNGARVPAQSRSLSLNPFPGRPGAGRNLLDPAPEGTVKPQHPIRSSLCPPSCRQSVCHGPWHRGALGPGAAARAASWHGRPSADGGSRMTDLTPAEWSLLLRLQRLALRYFLENQLAGGLVLDRQRNHGPRAASGLCSTAATGMGLIALALAAAPPYRLLPRGEAVTRIRAALETAWARLPHTSGILPHFVRPDGVTPAGSDRRSTIDSAWLLAGGLWAAQFLGDPGLEWLARRLYDRVDWRYWTAPDVPGGCGLLRHGEGPDGRCLGYVWDRLNGETIHLYVLAAGAAAGRALAPAAWAALRPCYGTVA